MSTVLILLQLTLIFKCSSSKNPCFVKHTITCSEGPGVETKRTIFEIYSNLTIEKPELLLQQKPLTGVPLYYSWEKFSKATRKHRKYFIPETYNFEKWLWWTCIESPFHNKIPRNKLIEEKSNIFAKVGNFQLSLGQVTRLPSSNFHY